MTKKDLTQKIEIFKKDCEKFNRLLLNSRDDVLPDIVKNHDKISKMRSKLNRTYASLEKYIKIFGNNPRMSDGVWANTYPVYNNAFSSDILQRVGPSLDAVVQDLDYIAGKLESMTNHEFNRIVVPSGLNQKKKIPRTKHKQLKSTGIINTGNHNKFKNCNIVGSNTGVKNTGSSTEFNSTKISNKQRKVWYESWWFQAIIALAVLLIGSYLIWRFGWTK